MNLNQFDQQLSAGGQFPLRRARTEILQINVGKLCNQTCNHCHVNAGPGRKEIMTRATIDRIVDWLVRTDIPKVDITGGAPEIVPDFRYFVERIKKLNLSVRRGSPTPPMSDRRSPRLPGDLRSEVVRGQETGAQPVEGLRRQIMDRCNLTIFFEPGHEDLPEFLARHEIEVVASLPCYTAGNVDAQRGDGVFDKSIRALQWLNRLGYGTRLPLHLVYNPVGAKLPGPQVELEADYHAELQQQFGIVFNRLYTITNMPIARFAVWLRQNGEYDRYMDLLVANFNPASVDGLMCRNTLSIGWRGEVYDCDFNQMLDMQWRRNGHHSVGAASAPRPVGDEKGRRTETAPTSLYLWDIDPATLENREILTGDHCFGCTAGAGSSCRGALVK